MERSDQYTALSDENPWEDSDWIPATAEFLLPKDRLERMLLETPVKAVTSSEFVTVGPTDSMELALWRMRQRGLRAALVMEGEALMGIVTERDAVLNMVPGETGEALIVGVLMTPDPVLIGMDEPVGAAVQRLAVEGVHHLPVIDEMEAKVVGVVTQGPLVHRIIETLLNEEWAGKPGL
jgi:CBS domain-containing protein